MDGRSRSTWILNQNKPLIVQELDVTNVLPQLVQKGIFSYFEEREILTFPDSRSRTELFVDLLSKKGAGPFEDFCNILEHAYPRLLSALVDNSGGYSK